jgi:hypothetical protein
MISGECLCGAVRFETSARGVIGYCHCAVCRKATGAIFATPFNVEREGFRFLQGEEQIRSHADIVEGSARRFCGICGSSLSGGPDTAPWIAVPAGLLDRDPGQRPRGHVFFRSRVPWLELDDALPRFERWPPGREPAWARDDPSRDPGPPTCWKVPGPGEPVRGSCLCGSVRYAVDLSRAPQRFGRCHCSRCRRLTGSAYACSLYVEPARFGWTEGREHVVRYDLPTARSFANEFCGRCGSCLPHATRSGREIVVLTGTLDDDPGIRMQGERDIFLEDRAPWV